MIISRTPFRISFFGGGTDYPGWFNNHKGAVLATTINKYCYITCRHLPPFFKHKSRIIYSVMEHVKKVDEIHHPAVREVLKFMKINDGLEIHHDGDLPARTGLGASSSFTVGLLNAMYALRGEMPSKEKLAKEAIFIEQEKCRDDVGCQDQVLAAHGGLNYIKFGGANHLSVTSITIPQERLKRFQNHMMLYFTGVARKGYGGYKITSQQVKNIPKKQSELSTMYQMTNRALEMLNKDDLAGFGKLLNENWQIKRELSNKITTPLVDQIYDTAMRSGAYGGKLLGAGGGGFVLIYADPSKQKKIKEKLKNLLLVPFHFEGNGSQIIFYQPNGEYEK